MTIETRIVASVDDIRHIEVTCPDKDCTGRLFVDLDYKIKTEQKCPQCSAHWWAHNPAPDRKPHPVFVLLSALVSHRARINGDHGIEIIFPGPS